MKITIILLLSSLFIACGENKPKYTRSECIVKTKIFWDENLTKKEWRKINNDFYSAIDLMWFNRDRLKLLIPSVNFSGFPQLNNNKFPKFMYSEYDNECENKEKMLFVFLENVKFYVPDFPKYKITLEVVEPGVGTVL